MDLSVTASPRQARPTRWYHSKQIVFSGGIVFLFILMATVGPIMMDYDPIRTDTSARLLSPGSSVGGETAWLGTDQLGRSVLDQVVHGARVSLLVAGATIILGGIVGTFIGLLSGYYGGKFDSLAMRLADIQLGIPSVLLAILIAGVLGPSLTNVIITLAITRWPLYARIARSAAISARAKPFVDSARLIGAPERRIMFLYVFPTAIGSLTVVSTAQVGQMILAEASLSFLGLGVPLQEASWGSIIANGRDYLDSAWWIATAPGVVLVAVVVAIGFLSDALRDRLDPGSGAMNV